MRAQSEGRRRPSDGRKQAGRPERARAEGRDNGVPADIWPLWADGSAARLCLRGCSDANDLPKAVGSQHKRPGHPPA
jgi:hypothetical protein